MNGSKAKAAALLFSLLLVIDFNHAVRGHRKKSASLRRRTVIMEIVRPPCPVDVRQCELQKQVTYRGRIEGIGIEQCSILAHALLYPIPISCASVTSKSNTRSRSASMAFLWFITSSMQIRRCLPTL